MTQLSLQEIALNQYEHLQNMARFYVYDCSKSVGDLPHWEIPASGLFECYDLKNYITDQDRRAYFILSDHEIAGFILVNQAANLPNIDWVIAEFFVLGKFQGRGLGAKTLPLLFKELPGIWEVSVMPFNEPALKFWQQAFKKLASQKVIQDTYEMTEENAVTKTPANTPNLKNIFKIETF